MDPLSVASSIAGLVSAADMVNKALGPYIAAARDTPKIAVQVYSETQSAAIILGALQNLTKNLATINRQRAALIQLDQVVAVLTDGVLIFSDLEACVGDLPPAEPSITPLALRYRLGWARKESALSALLGRLEAFKSSMSLMLNILQSDSSLQAEQSQQELTANVALLLQNSKKLARRLVNLEDVFDARSVITRSTRHSYAPSTASVSTAADALADRLDWPHPTPVNSDDDTVSVIFSPISSTFSDQPSPLPSSESTRTTTPTRSSGAGPLSSQPARLTASSALQRPFECDLELSRVYRRAQNFRNSMDFSFRSSIARTNAWSVFSGMSLGDISVLSVIALPIYADDLRNSHHYDFGDRVASGVPITATPCPAREPVPDLLPCPHSFLRSCLEQELLLAQLPPIEKRLAATRRAWSDLGYAFLGAHPFSTLCSLFMDGYSFLHLVDMVEHDKNANTLPYSPKKYEITSLNKYRILTDAISVASEIVGIKNIMFTYSDINGDCGNIGFIKVFRVFQSLLSLLMEAGHIVPVDEELGRHMETVESNPRHENSEAIKIVIEDFVQAEISYINDLTSVETLWAYIAPANRSSLRLSLAIFRRVRKLIEIHISLLLIVEKNLLREPRRQRWAPAFELWSNHAKLYGAVISDERRNKAWLRSRLAHPIENEVTRCLELFSVPSRRPEEYLRFVEDLQRLSNNGESRGFFSPHTLDICKAVPIVHLAVVAIEELTDRPTYAKPKPMSLRYVPIRGKKQATDIEMSMA